MIDREYLPGRRPVAGDHLTLFTIDEIAYWTRQGESTIRRWINNGKIRPEFLTRPGGRILMTGDQLISLIASWRGVQPKGADDPQPRRRRVVRLDPHKPVRRNASLSR
ncbi:helix-turn-helix domain-containing protein [Allorhizocola rhizosphaerae]|uniref:helix-turn-helix domain-containing protein n=1 Tax=Allorhizocola rhizosphaerae TaxID=1872709 RepID=UPI000E3D5347|nr:helix-turn-helix domain-containing protein [Allorhizocola rhizosphaerae]